MPTNLEIKAAYDSVKLARKHARRIGARYVGTLNQIDTYFKVTSGRLKLREINGKKSELIYYHRSNVKKSRYSQYTILEVKNPALMKEMFRSLFGIWTIVKKKRILFLYRNARIHIDSVKKLGTFLEFEIIVGHDKKRARSLMSFLCKEFAVKSESFVGGSYSDMVRER